jgi:hypothetical protein
VGELGVGVVVEDEQAQERLVLMLGEAGNGPIKKHSDPAANSRAIQRSGRVRRAKRQ